MIAVILYRLSLMTRSTVCSMDQTTAHYQIGSMDVLEKRIQTCRQMQFTGWLDLEIKDQPALQWSLFFRLGKLIGGASEIHPIRRWCRQLSRHCPQLATDSIRGGMQQPQYWNQSALVKMVRQGRISQEQLEAVVESHLVEVLFDLLQLSQQHFQQLATQLTYKRLPQNLLTSSSISISVDRVLQPAQQAWKLWQQAGLGEWSPNLAPVVWDAEELRRQTSLLAYHNLTKLADGDRTLRDIAITLKQPLIPLTRSIVPYLQKGIMGLVEVDDLRWEQTAATSATPEAGVDLTSTAPVRVRSSSPLVAYIEDSRLDSVVMSQILSQAGYRFINVRDPVQALPILLEHKPSLIFLDLLMPVTNGYEVCTQLRRVSAFKDTPVIIVTSSDGIVDRVRAKLAGSSGFIAKPIDPETVVSVLQSHLPRAR